MLDQQTINLPNAGEIVFQQLGTSKALKYSVSLGKAAASIAAGFIRNQFEADSDKSKIVWDPVVVIRGLMEYLDEEKSPELIKNLVKDSVIKPEWGNGDWYEAKFSANFPELMQLLEAIIKSNYGGALELVGKTMSGTPEKSGDSIKTGSESQT